MHREGIIYNTPCFETLAHYTAEIMQWLKKTYAKNTSMLGTRLSSVTLVAYLSVVKFNWVSAMLSRGIHIGSSREGFIPLTINTF